MQVFFLLPARETQSRSYTNFPRAYYGREVGKKNRWPLTAHPCAVKAEETSEQVQRIQTDNFTAEIEQQEKKRALMTQASFPFREERNLERSFVLV